ncbi:hypothetical protein [Fulvivirga ulvae]|nr:hypothetical protein [Fulvivirga ulvae]
MLIREKFRVGYVGYGKLTGLELPENELLNGGFCPALSKFPRASG